MNLLQLEEAFRVVYGLACLLIWPNKYTFTDGRSRQEFSFAVSFFCILTDSHDHSRPQILNHQIFNAVPARNLADYQ